MMYEELLNHMWAILPRAKGIYILNIYYNALAAFNYHCIAGADIGRIARKTDKNARQKSRGQHVRWPLSARKPPTQQGHASRC